MGKVSPHLLLWDYCQSLEEIFFQERVTLGEDDIFTLEDSELESIAG